MFGCVQTNDFFFCGSTQANGVLDNQECNGNQNSCPCSDAKQTQQLRAKQAETAAVEQTCASGERCVRCCEQTNCNDAPQTVEEVNCNSTNRVINVQYMV